MTAALDNIQVRAGRDEDSTQLIELIGSCFAEYPGCILDVDGEMPELLAIATSFAAQRGRFWVAEHDGRIAGSIGLTPAVEGNGAELRKLYVVSPWRRRGLGAHLCGLVEEEARQRGAGFIELWTDTRFLDAHRLYRRLGYVGGVQTRELHDLSHTIEFYFRKTLT